MINKNKMLEELAIASKPLIEFLEKYYDPHTSVIVTEGYIKVVTDEIGINTEGCI